MSENPICNKATYLQFCEDLGEEDAADVLRAFLDDTQLKVNALSSDGQRAHIKTEAHSLKSSSATFGFLRLSELGRSLESGTETMATGDVQKAIEIIQAVFDITERFARAELLSETAVA
jgi:HPt (histidine-containing phosphotransfer) domain-containing protein